MNHFKVYDLVKDKLVLAENISQAAQFLESGASVFGISSPYLSHWRDDESLRGTTGGLLQTRIRHWSRESIILKAEEWEQARHSSLL